MHSFGINGEDESGATVLTKVHWKMAVQMVCVGVFVCACVCVCLCVCVWLSVRNLQDCISEADVRES